MSKYLIDILIEINEDPKNIDNYKNNNALKLLFEYAFNPANKFILPEGVPPYKEDAAPLGMSPANFTMEMKKLYVFCRPELNNVRRETIFIQLLENLHPSEAKVLLAIKDQTLSKMYKNITHKMVYDADMVSVPPVEIEKVKKSRPKGGTEDLDKEKKEQDS